MLALAAGLGLTALAVGMAAGAKPRDEDPMAYSAEDLEQALRASCRVTGCDPSTLAALYRAGVPAMDDDELAEAAEIARHVAIGSAAAVSAASGGDPDRHAVLAARAAADAAVSRLHAAEIARRAATAS